MDRILRQVWDKATGRDLVCCWNVLPEFFFQNVLLGNDSGVQKFLQLNQLHNLSFKISLGMMVYIGN